MAGSSDIDKAKVAGKVRVSLLPRNLAELTRSQIFLVGLILQLISFASYMMVFALFVYRMQSERVAQWNETRTEPLRWHWKGVVWAVAISCLGITVRCTLNLYPVIPTDKKSHYRFDAYTAQWKAVKVSKATCSLTKFIFMCSMFFRSGLLSCKLRT
jgi:hypothetical protein